MARVTTILAAFEGMAMERLPDGRFTLVGDLPAWCRALRREGLQWSQPFLAEDAFPFLSSFLPEAEQAWFSDPPRRVESDLWTEVDREGNEVHLEATAVTINKARTLVIMRNDRLFAQGEKLLQRARELRMTHSALMKETEQKDILVHAIVHDLAAPLHSIIGVLSLLSEQPHSDPSAQWIRLAMQAAIRQRELITEILDVFAAGDGALGPRVTEGVDVGEIVERVVAERDPVARRRSVRLEKDIPAAVGRVRADDTRLFRVLTNLTDNALRYSPQNGTVRVAISRDEDETITIAVEDDGPGVPAAVLPRLFEKFGRGRDAGAGTGLGLFYCRITVENWGGGIGYEPREKGGARFWIRLRAMSPARDEQRKGRRETDGEAPAARR